MAPHVWVATERSFRGKSAPRVPFPPSGPSVRVELAFVTTFQFASTLHSVHPAHYAKEILAD
jgi:hypothetical protein